MAFIQRELFGGAITAQTPSNLLDAAEIRQVPDNQEVLLYPDSAVSIIVEILEKVEPSEFNDAVRYHFDSLAHDNSAVSAVVDTVNIIPNDRGDDTPSAILLSGTQHVPKYNHTEPDAIHILMALYRVTSKAIDIVVSFNVPTKTGNDDEISRDYEDEVRKHFEKFIRSLRIIDYGLFA